MGLIPLGILSSAGSGFGTYELIQTQILGSNTASITFSGLGAYADTYKHLQIRLTGKTTRVQIGANIVLRFNGDTGSNYSWHSLIGNGSIVTSIASASTTLMLGAWVAGANTTANAFGAGVIDILDAYSTTKNKTMRTLNGLSGGEVNIRLGSGLWRNTNAITSVTIFDADSTNLVTGSRFSIYGIR
jgi:hypothetical protein